MFQLQVWEKIEQKEGQSWKRRERDGQGDGPVGEVLPLSRDDTLGKGRRAGGEEDGGEVLFKSMVVR